MVQLFNLHGENKNCLQNFGSKTWPNETLERLGSRCEDNIKKTHGWNRKWRCELLSNYSQDVLGRDAVQCCGGIPAFGRVKMEAARLPETLVSYHNTTLRQNQEHFDSNLHHREDLKFRTYLNFSC
jgi:hypothetical protein